LLPRTPIFWHFGQKTDARIAKITCQGCALKPLFLACASLFLFARFPRRRQPFTQSQEVIMGRPQKSEPQKKIKVRLDADEYVDWKHLLSASGLSQTEYMRKLITGFVPRKQPEANFFLFKKAVSRVTNNLHQISSYAERNNLPEKNYLREAELEIALLHLEIHKVICEARPLTEKVLFEFRERSSRVHEVSVMVDFSEYKIFVRRAVDAQMQKMPFIRKLISLHKKIMDSEKSAGFNFGTAAASTRDIGLKLNAVAKKLQASTVFDHQAYTNYVSALNKILKNILTGIL
jgi:hypothetical protein